MVLFLSLFPNWKERKKNININIAHKIRSCSVVFLLLSLCRTAIYLALIFD
jgi:hypothetical protein